MSTYKDTCQSQGYNEDTLLESGLNSAIADKIFMCDLLRIDFAYEIRPEFATRFLE